jgi:hypothetical protein
VSKCSPQTIQSTLIHFFKKPEPNLRISQKNPQQENERQFLKQQKIVNSKYQSRDWNIFRRNNLIRLWESAVEGGVTIELSFRRRDAPHVLCAVAGAAIPASTAPVGPSVSRQW